MFKTILLTALIALAMARPSIVSSAPFITYTQPIAIHQQAYATVGSVVKTVPTSVSHASHSIVHKSDNVVQDVVAPVLRTSYVTPVVRAITAPTYGYVNAASPYSISSW